MSNEVAVEILGKTYKIKCPIEKTNELKQAAIYVDKEMRNIRDHGSIIGLDRIAIITALNFSYQLLNLEQKENKDIDDMSDRIVNLQSMIEEALIPSQQLELEQEN